MSDHPRDMNIAMVSSGNPEQDQKDLEAFRQREYLLAEGLCVNCKIPMKITTHMMECVKCGYTFHSVRIKA